MGLVGAIRTIRGEMGIPPLRPLAATIKPAGSRQADLLQANGPLIEALARVQLSVDPAATRPTACAVALVSGIECYVRLEGVVDLAGEARRLRKELAKAEEALRFVEEKLGRDEFRSRAPAEVVGREVSKREDLNQTVRRLRESLERIGEAEA